MEPPDHIQNVALWQSHCRKIRARAVDLIEGRIGTIVAARDLGTLGVASAINAAAAAVNRRLNAGVRRQ